MPDQKTFAFRAASTLAALSILPVAGFIALDRWTQACCTEATVASGRLEGALVWRIGRADCTGGQTPFYDVSVGADGHALATAATSRDAPVPLDVRRVDADHIGVTLDRPWRGKTLVAIRLRRTGGPAERIDLGSQEP